ncbi:MAG TPA: hypothetical protein VNG31_00055 [Candidatus Baltobacteraceae bacterium]|nr:hypothetical protein [Candidatus Baltobacteraceae bacterium]
MKPALTFTPLRGIVLDNLRAAKTLIGAKHLQQRYARKALWVALSFTIAYLVNASRAQAGTISWASIDCTKVPKALDGVGLEPRSLAISSNTAVVGLNIYGPKGEPWHGFITLWVNHVRRFSASESVAADAKEAVDLRVYRVPIGTPEIEVTLDNPWGDNIQFTLCPHVPGNYVVKRPGD